jgi:hypothetical protein
MASNSVEHIAQNEGSPARQDDSNMNVDFFLASASTHI